MSERDKTIGPWTIKGKLGEGGNAVVYVAERRGEPEVALKVLNATNVHREPYRRFVRPLDYFSASADKSDSTNQENPNRTIEKSTSSTCSESMSGMARTTAPATATGSAPSVSASERASSAAASTSSRQVRRPGRTTTKSAARSGSSPSRDGRRCADPTGSASSSPVTSRCSPKGPQAAIRSSTARMSPAECSSSRPRHRMRSSTIRTAARSDSGREPRVTSQSCEARRRWTTGKAKADWSPARSVERGRVAVERRAADAAVRAGCERSARACGVEPVRAADGRWRS
jgi:hypothetical protein